MYISLYVKTYFKRLNSKVHFTWNVFDKAYLISLICFCNQDLFSKAAFLVTCIILIC